MMNLFIINANIVLFNEKKGEIMYLVFTSISSALTVYEMHGCPFNLSLFCNGIDKVGLYFRGLTEQGQEVTPVAVCLWEASMPSVPPTVEGE